MKPPTFSPFGQPRDSRECVIWVLADRPLLRLRRLHRAVLRMLGRRLSSQGLFKLLAEMTAEGQIKKFSRGVYGINPEWITQVRAFLDVIERNSYAAEADEEVKV